MNSAITENLPLLKRLTAINRTITTSLDIEKSLHLIADSGLDLVRATSCLVLLREGEENLRVRAARGVDPSVPWEFTGPMEETILADLRRKLQLDEFRSMAVAPIISESTVQGIMVVVRDTPLEPEETWLLTALADQAAITLRNARLHEELLTREARLQESAEYSRSLVQELDTLIQTIAHDLRSPLRSMTICGELLLGEYGPQFLRGKGREYLARIESGARKMDALIQDLLTYSNLARGGLTLEPVGLEEAVREALADLAPEVAGRDVVRVDFPLPRVLANRAVLIQILRNLLSNALKFVRPGALPSVRIQAERLEDLVRVSVSDTGIGISEEYLDRIFGIFERLNRAEDFPGTGIGLAIVRKGMDRMDGRVGVESELGKGSRFWVELRGA